MHPYLWSLAGGLLIGLAAAALLVGYGRIAGVSSVLGGAVRPLAGDLAWRVCFLAGLVGGGALLATLRPAAFPSVSEASTPLLAGAGLLVGFGTRLGGGCTSGHGVCGLGRLSTRALAATLTFMAAGAATVLVVRHLGGAP